MERTVANPDGPGAVAFGAFSAVATSACSSALAFDSIASTKPQIAGGKVLHDVG